jgi:hypothetical protein
MVALHSPLPLVAPGSQNHFDSLDQVNNLREIQALRRLSPHPHIIKLLEVLYDQPTGNEPAGPGSMMRCDAASTALARQAQPTGAPVLALSTSTRAWPVDESGKCRS